MTLNDQEAVPPNGAALATQLHALAVRPLVTAAVARGVLRHLVQAGHAPMTEVPLPDGRRADVMALGPDGRITIIEVKSCPADYLTDRKWHAYSAFCDLFGFAVSADFPLDLLPGEPGILVADAYDAAMVRPLQALCWHQRAGGPSISASRGSRLSAR